MNKQTPSVTNINKRYDIGIIVCFLMICAFYTSSVYAQSLQEDYLPLQAKGEIPKDFLFQAMPESAIVKERIGRSSEVFQVQSAFLQNRILTSGRVIFGDTISQYLQKVGRVILNNRPILQEKLRFYVLRSSEADAFITHDGVVLVSMGLLSKLKTEAELAYILCHEISHFEAGHTWKLYIKNDKEGNTPGLDGILSYYSYQKKLEFEADSLGLLMFAQTGYALNAALSAFQVINAAPHQDTSLSKNIPWVLLGLDTAFIGQNISSNPTYPSLIETATSDLEMQKVTLLRKRKISNFITNFAAAGENFKVSAPLFQYIQTICRFENCLTYLDAQKYENALTETGILLKQYPKNAYLHNIASYSLYALARYANQGRLWDVHTDYSSVKGGLSAICFQIEAAQGLPLSLLALKKSWDVYYRYPYSPISDLMIGDLIQDIGKHFVEYDKFFSANKDSLSYPAIRALIATFPNNNLFSLIWEKNLKKAAQNQPTKEAAASSPKQLFRQQQKLAYRGFSLGIDTIVIVEPVYQRVDFGKKETEELEVSTQMETGMIQKIREYASSQGLFVTVFHSKELQSSQITLFHRLTTLNAWYQEKKATEEVALIAYRHKTVVAISKRYGTPYFTWIGGVHFMGKSTENQRVFKRSLLIPKSIWIGNYTTLFYTEVYDIVNESYLIQYPKRVRINDHADIFHSVIYDILFQIHQK